MSRVSDYIFWGVISLTITAPFWSFVLRPEGVLVGW